MRRGHSFFDQKKLDRKNSWNMIKEEFNLKPGRLRKSTLKAFGKAFMIKHGATKSPTRRKSDGVFPPKSAGSPTRSMSAVVSGKDGVADSSSQSRSLAMIGGMNESGAVSNDFFGIPWTEESERDSGSPDPASQLHFRSGGRHSQSTPNLRLEITSPSRNTRGHTPSTPLVEDKMSATINRSQRNNILAQMQVEVSEPRAPLI